MDNMSDKDADFNDKMLEKIYIFSSVVVFIFSLAPLFYIAKFDFPGSDDFPYSETTQKVWDATHSAGMLLRESINTSVRFWHSWQGLYSSAALQSLQPILSIVAGMMSLTVFLMRRYFKSRYSEALFIGAALSFYAIQYMPDISEGIYWFNGAVNYVFFWSLQSFYIICILMSRGNSTGSSNHENMTAWRVLFLFIASVLGFYIEGGNLVTAFFAILFTFGVLIYDIVDRDRKNACIDIYLLVLLIAGFLLNILSTGTLVRKLCFSADNPVKAVIAAGCDGLCILPFTISLLFCPPYYAMGFAGTGRLVNTVFFSFIVLCSIALVYFLGWMYRRTDEAVLWKLCSEVSVRTDFCFCVRYTCDWKQE